MQEFVPKEYFTPSLDSYYNYEKCSGLNKNKDNNEGLGFRV